MAESADFLINRRSPAGILLRVSCIFVADGAKTELRLRVRAFPSNLASLTSNPAMMRVLQEHLPQLAHRDISEALANVEQLVEYIPDARSRPSSKLSTRR